MAPSERRSQFSIVALRMLVAEKTGGFRMLMPALSEDTGETLLPAVAGEMMRAGDVYVGQASGEYLLTCACCSSLFHQPNELCSGRRGRSLVVCLCVTRTVIISHPYCAEAIQWIQRCCLKLPRE
jgi:hypothetical protein